MRVTQTGIKRGLGVAALGCLIYGGLGSLVHHTNKNSVQEIEKMISPSYVQMVINQRERHMERIKELISNKRILIEDLKYDKDFAVRFDEEIEKYRQEIKGKIENGYLTPKHEYWEDYKAIFGSEAWWPEEK